jgi:hypothetical protein
MQNITTQTTLAICANGAGIGICDKIQKINPKTIHITSTETNRPSMEHLKFYWNPTIEI